MKLTPIQANLNEVQINDDLKILFSYQTPVACWINGEGYYKTATKWSNTTTRHINKWLDGANAGTHYQEYFDNLANGNA